MLDLVYLAHYLYSRGKPEYYIQLTYLFLGFYSHLLQTRKEMVTQLPKLLSCQMDIKFRWECVYT